MIRSVSVIYANYRYSLPMYSFSVYQVLIQELPLPVYLRPNASHLNLVKALLEVFLRTRFPHNFTSGNSIAQLYHKTLSDDQSVEVIPQPWS